jgi:hypothetical protein
MEQLLKDLFYKGINFTISVHDPVGNYNSDPVGWKADRIEFGVEKDKWIVEAVYTDGIALKIKSLGTKPLYNYHFITYNSILDICWSESE